MRVLRLNIMHHISRAACLCVLAACSSDVPTRYAPTPPVSEPQASDALIVLDFTMTEFRYASDPDNWYYAPELRVVAAPGRIASLHTVMFSIPGLGYTFAFDCSATIDPRAPREFFGEGIDWGIGVYAGRASGADATAQITYFDDAGNTVTRALRAPIIQGSVVSSTAVVDRAC